MKYFLLKALMFVCIITSANAATIKEHEPNSYGCTISLDGVIVAGDSDIIKPLLYETYEKISLGIDELAATLCLNSPGGDLNEGIKIANFVSEYYTNTVVGADARCESSCAVIFLASCCASLDPRGAIGLHAPKLLLPSGNFTEEDVAKAYDLSVFTVREIMRMPTFPPAGVRYMTSTPSSEMYIPKTFFEVSELGVNLREFSGAPRQLPVEQQMESACRWGIWENNGGSYFDNPMERVIEFVGFKGVSSNVAELKIEAEFTVHAEEETSYPCNVKFGFGKDGVTGNLDRVTRINVNGQEIYSDVYIYPPNASYLDIYRLPELSPDQFIEMAKAIEEDVTEKENENLQILECSIAEPQARIVNVSDFTNLREQPGLSGRVIAGVALGATVTQQTPNRYFATDRCIAACRADDKPQIQQCIDSNEVWIEVQYQGGTGFLSRKFLQ